MQRVSATSHARSLGLAVRMPLLLTVILQLDLALSQYGQSAVLESATALALALLIARYHLHLRR